MTRADGELVYEYVLLYTDNCLVVLDNAERILREEIGRYFELKPSSVGPSSLYLGGHLRKVQVDSGVTAWAFSSTQYVQTAVFNVETHLKEKGKGLKPKTNGVLPRDYRPKINVPEELGVKKPPIISH